MVQNMPSHLLLATSRTQHGVHGRVDLDMKRIAKIISRAGSVVCLSDGLLRQLHELGQKAEILKGRGATVPIYFQNQTVNTRSTTERHRISRQPPLLS